MLTLTKNQAEKDIKAAKQQLKIAKKNLEFASLSNAEKRVQIAKDVLAQLALKKIQPEQGAYVESSNGETCQACALGALFVCTAVRTGNKLEDVVLDAASDDYFGFDHIREQLSPLFSEAQLGKIERAFEGWGAGDEPSDTNKYGSLMTEAYNDGISSPRVRMERIMRNIIANNGTFVPSKG